jgi:N-acyl-D-amino-acid deacylase
VLGRHVREAGELDLAQAIHKMTGLAASHVGIEDRGTVAVGKAADLVLFDPETVLDRATPEDPLALSVGVERVWVNGVEVWRDGGPTGARPGRVIRRGS